MAVLTCFPVAGRCGDNEAAICRSEAGRCERGLDAAPLGGQGPVAVVAGPGAPDRPDRRGRAGRRAATAPGTDGTPRPEGPPPAGRPAAGPPQPETASCPRQPPAATGNSRQSRTCPVVPPPPRPVATSSPPTHPRPATGNPPPPVANEAISASSLCRPTSVAVRWWISRTVAQYAGSARRRGAGSRRSACTPGTPSRAHQIPPSATPGPHPGC